jgi:hypothetical protein
VSKREGKQAWAAHDRQVLGGKVCGPLVGRHVRALALCITRGALGVKLLLHRLLLLLPLLLPLLQPARSARQLLLLLPTQLPARLLLLLLLLQPGGRLLGALYSCRCLLLARGRRGGHGVPRGAIYLLHQRKRVLVACGGRGGGWGQRTRVLAAALQRWNKRDAQRRGGGGGKGQQLLETLSQNRKLVLSNTPGAAPCESAAAATAAAAAPLHQAQQPGPHLPPATRSSWWSPPGPAPP